MILRCPKMYFRCAFDTGFARSERRDGELRSLPIVRGFQANALNPLLPRKVSHSIAVLQRGDVELFLKQSAEIRTAHQTDSMGDLLNG